MVGVCLLYQLYLEAKAGGFYIRNIAKACLKLKAPSSWYFLGTRVLFPGETCGTYPPPILVSGLELQQSDLDGVGCQVKQLGSSHSSLLLELLFNVH